MRNINSTSLAEAKTRFLTLLLAASMLTVSVTAASQSLTAVSTPMVRKVQRVQRESRDVIRFSVRLYRFYKLSSERPAIETRGCE